MYVSNYLRAGRILRYLSHCLHVGLIGGYVDIHLIQRERLRGASGLCYPFDHCLSLFDRDRKCSSVANNGAKKIVRHGQYQGGSQIERYHQPQ